MDGSTIVNCPGTVVVNGPNIDTCGSNDTITINADRTFTQTGANGSSSGTVSVSDNLVTLNYNVKNGLGQNPILVRQAHFTVNNTTLSLRPFTPGTTVENNETQTSVRIVSPPLPQITGSYRKVTIGQDGSSAMPCPSTLFVGGSAVDSCGSGETLTLFANGTYTQTDATGVSSGTYVTNGNTLTMTLTVDHGTTLGTPVVKSSHFTFNATTLTIRPFTSGTNAESGETVVETRTS